MSRLPIALDDGWTRSKLTQVRAFDDSIAGCGISLDVWQHLFDFTDGSWYAVVDGGYHDNVTLVSLDWNGDQFTNADPFVLSADAKEYENVSPLLESFPFRALSQEILNSCGAQSFDTVTVGEGVRATLRLHDDFIFSISRNAPGLVEEALGLIIRVHQHYLDIDLASENERELSNSVLEILRREGSLEIQADVTENHLRISYERPLPGWFSRLFHRQQKVQEIVAVQ